MRGITVKKRLVLPMISILLAGMLSACSNNQEASSEKSKSAEINSEGFPIVDEKITLSMFGPNVGRAKWEDMKYFKMMEKKTNIHFEFDTPPNDSFETQKNLLFASNELPDIFYGASLTNSEIIKYSEQGLLVPLDDLIEKYAPNVQEMFKEYPDVKKSITALDGHIYALPTVDRTLQWNIHPMWYNGSFLKALNVKELPKTSDELYDLLVRIKTEDPNGNGKQDEIPLTAAEMWDINQWFMGFFGVVSIGVGTYDGEVKYGAAQPGFKNYLEFMNKLYKEELLDNEVFSQSWDQKGAKGKANRVGLFANWAPGDFLGMPNDTTNPMMQPVTGKGADKPVIAISPGQSVGQFAITNVNKNPEASMRWVDYSYSKEGNEFLSILDEGDIWEWADKDKNLRRLIPREDGTSIEDYKGTLTPNYGINVPTWAHLDSPIVYEGNAYDPFVVAETKNKIKPVGQVAMPQVFLTPEELKEVAAINADLEAYVEQMEAKFITGQEPISKWNEYIKTIDKMGVDKLVKIYQKAYDRYTKEK
jgi:putative aldouronate transport system substrate-binding protein